MVSDIGVGLSSTIDKFKPVKAKKVIKV
jgi:hypothetical protein